jgi:hypothetical protein
LHHGLKTIFEISGKFQRSHYKLILTNQNLKK